MITIEPIWLPFDCMAIYQKGVDYVTDETKIVTHPHACVHDVCASQ